jgi:short subunit dehydrogenase-like uncharacterized protein
LRSFDIVLFGATGFTGRLVADYLIGRRSGARLALAGRDRAKLEALRRELPGAAEVQILTADVRDPASLDAIAEKTRVVCTTVGPYARYGGPVVAACAAHGTDYCDLTGEPQWIRRMIDAHHDEAARTGARIVHCCGFDSIPSDLGTQLLEDHARAAYGAPCESVVLAIRRMRGGASGGTVASMLALFEEIKRDPAVRAIVFDPYALNPPGERSGPDGPDARGVAWDPDLEAWTAPFVMAGINTKVVRRTNALTGYAYGRSFRYREVMAFPRGARGLTRALGQAAFLGGLLAAASIDRVRGLLERVLPKPGEGPSPAERERGSFFATLLGKGTAADGRPFTVRGTVAAEKDPGYGATSIMLGESALSLAEDERTTPGGVLTPAYALGKKLLARLRAAGMRFEAAG